MQRTPHRDIRVIRAIEDGRYVFCHVGQILNQGQARWLTTDLFDTDENDLIVEHWDVIAPWEDASQADGPTQTLDLESTDRNKAVVAEFAAEVLVGRALDRIADFVAEDLIQHEPGVGHNASAWTARLSGCGTPGDAVSLRRLESSSFDNIFEATSLPWRQRRRAGGSERQCLLAQRGGGCVRPSNPLRQERHPCLVAAPAALRYCEVFRLVGQGNFVVTYSKVDIGAQAHAVFDIFRLEDERIVERWTNAEAVPNDTGNSGKF